MKRYAKDYDPSTLVVPKCAYSNEVEKVKSLAEKIKRLQDFISNDSQAVTFQSLAQYRKAVLVLLDT